MKRKKVLRSFIILITFSLLNSCSNDVVSKNSNNKKSFQTVVLDRNTVKRYFDDPSFSYFIFQYRTNFLGGISLEVTPFDINNAIMSDKIRLTKLPKSETTPLLNSFPAYYKLTKKRMENQEVDGSADYVLTPQPYVDSLPNRDNLRLGKGQRLVPSNYVSYRVDQQIQPFRKAFKPFTLDPSPPAP